ncbi:hypothetical protein MESS2_1650036 [Mesorhizobium metallidurans STM 2683]|uniref:Uncharacterized protein n=1 Tax=Mesorhizobium metallidurans STM 2683 TaxID=1297569 RepID=M5ENN1_9HYPH|nr:hypothetical protein MESS2_1650036 [Mesorhizobium metallidurans STM 2683]
MLFLQAGILLWLRAFQSVQEQKAETMWGHSPAGLFGYSHLLEAILSMTTMSPGFVSVKRQLHASFLTVADHARFHGVLLSDHLPSQVLWHS